MLYIVGESATAHTTACPRQIATNRALLTQFYQDKQPLLLEHMTRWNLPETEIGKVHEIFEDLMAASTCPLLLASRSLREKSLLQTGRN